MRTVYFCEMCGKGHGSWEACFKCETNHVYPVTATVYDDSADTGVDLPPYRYGRFPNTICVTMSDRSKVIYKLVKPLRASHSEKMEGGNMSDVHQD